LCILLSFQAATDTSQHSSKGFPVTVKKIWEMCTKVWQMTWDDRYLCVNYVKEPIQWTDSGKDVFLSVRSPPTSTVQANHLSHYEVTEHLQQELT